MNRDGGGFHFARPQPRNTTACHRCPRLWTLPARAGPRQVPRRCLAFTGPALDRECCGGEGPHPAERWDGQDSGIGAEMPWFRTSSVPWSWRAGRLASSQGEPTGCGHDVWPSRLIPVRITPGGAFAGGHPLPSSPVPGGSSSTATGGNGNRCGVAQDPGAWPSRGATRVPGRGARARHDCYRRHSPAETGRRTRTSQHAACPTAPGQSAAPGLVTSCRSQRRCSSGRDDDACVTAGQTAIVLWILPLKMPLTGRTLTGFGFELCV